MIVVVTPRLGSEHLDGSIEGGRAGYQEAEQGGIEGIDVAKMHDICLAPQKRTHGIGSTHDHAKGKEEEQMGIGEDIDKLGDGVVGRYTL
jgi:hypothetical protein